MTTSVRASQARSITSHTVNNRRSRAKCSLSDFTLHPPPTSIILPAPPRSGQLSGVRPCIQTRNCSGESPADGGWGGGVRRQYHPVAGNRRLRHGGRYRVMESGKLNDRCREERPRYSCGAGNFTLARTNAPDRQTDRQTDSAETPPTGPPPIIVLYTLASSVVLSNGIGQ